MLPIALAALTLAVVVAPTAQPVVPSQDRTPSAPTYYWRWSDGSTSATRTLSEPVSGLPPRIIVTASPPVPGARVELQFRSGRSWRTEDVATTDRSGRALLSVNPYCSDGAWCRTAFDYRIRVDGRSATLTVRFA